MNILNDEELQGAIDRYVCHVHPREEDFKAWFRKYASSPLLIDAKLEANMPEVARDLGAGYFDLAKADDYDALARELAFYPDGIIFDNIDAIPATEAKEWLEQLVRYGLKCEEDVPLPDRKMIDFSKVKFGARCQQLPAYLEEIYSQFIKIWIE